MSALREQLVDKQRNEHRHRDDEGPQQEQEVRAGVVHGFPFPPPPRLALRGANLDFRPVWAIADRRTTHKTRTLPTQWGGRGCRKILGEIPDTRPCGTAGQKKGGGRRKEGGGKAPGLGILCGKGRSTDRDPGPFALRGAISSYAEPALAPCLLRRRGTRSGRAGPR